MLVAGTRGVAPVDTTAKRSQEFPGHVVNEAVLVDRHERCGEDFASTGRGLPRSTLEFKQDSLP